MTAVGVSFRAGGELCPNGVSDLVGYAVLAEELGFRDFDASDHLLLDGMPENYPGGVFRWEQDSLWPDPLVLLSAVSSVTSRIGLTTSVLVVPLRPAVVIAKMAATVDNLSGGRLRLGMGAGWNRVEFDATGTPFVGRTKRMEDTIGACRALWGEGSATFHSETVSFEGVVARPLPAHHIPILLGGPATPGLADRVARLADGWNPMQSQRDEFAEGVALLREAFEAHGRDPGSLVVRAAIEESVVSEALEQSDASILCDEISRLAELGVTDVKLYVSGAAQHPDEVRDVLSWIADAVRPVAS